MNTVLPFALFPVLLWGGALQTNVTTEGDGGTQEIKEDDESFQEQEQRKTTGFARCNETLLQMASEACQLQFEVAMHYTDEELWCDWQAAIKPYNQMSACMEHYTGRLGCFFPNPVVEAAFLQVHALYFHHCPDLEDAFSDAPHYVAVALTLVPVCLIPILVSLVVWKSKVRE